MNINILPKLLIVKISAFIIASVVLLTLAFFGLTFKSTTNAVLVSFVLIFIIGKFGLLAIKKLPPNISSWFYTHVFPDINGQWNGTITSNWSDSGEFSTKPVTVKIEHDLFSTKMSFMSDDEYTTSELVMSKLERDIRTNRFKLYYLYDSVTPQYENTDERSHHGAACLTIIYDNEAPEMKGTYWTDRNWRSGQNTAGEINLTRREEL